MSVPSRLGTSAQPTPCLLLSSRCLLGISSPCVPATCLPATSPPFLPSLPPATARRRGFSWLYMLVLHPRALQPQQGVSQGLPASPTHLDWSCPLLWALRAPQLASSVCPVQVCARCPVGDLLSDSVTDISSRLLHATLSVPSPGSLSLGSFPHVPCLPPSLGGKLLRPPIPTVLGWMAHLHPRAHPATVWKLVTS